MEDDKKTVLIVEDDQNLRKGLVGLINEYNFNVIEASDGDEALKMVEKFPVDLVLLDLMIPKISGEIVCREIKKSHPEIIVIVLTARAESSDVIRGFHIGADDYVPKPFSPEELIARIQTRLKIVENKDVSSQAKHPELSMKKINLRESMRVITLRLIFTEVIFAIATILSLTLIALLSNKFIFLNTVLLDFIIIVGLIAANILIVLIIILKWQTEYTEIAKEGIIKHMGILHKNQRKFICNYVEIISISQSLLGMILDYGTLKITESAVKEQIYISNISNPKSYIKVVETILSKKLKGNRVSYQ